MMFIKPVMSKPRRSAAVRLQRFVRCCLPQSGFPVPCFLLAGIAGQIRGFLVKLGLLRLLAPGNERVVGALTYGVEFAFFVSWSGPAQDKSRVSQERLQPRDIGIR